MYTARAYPHMYTDRHSCTGLCSSSAGGSKGGALVVLDVQQRLWRVRSQAARRGEPGAPACMSVLCVYTHARTHYTWMTGAHSAAHEDGRRGLECKAVPAAGN